MKQFNLFLFLLLLGFQGAHAQKNCCNPLDLFPATLNPIIIDQTTGSGETDNVSCSCLAGEGGSTWFSFSAVTSGLFEVLIQPKAPGADFNFALWEGACPCQVPPNPVQPVVFSVSCNNVAGNGPTGIATAPMSSFGVPGSPEFSSSFWVTPGENYFLLVTNVNNTGEGFTLTKGGSAVIAPQVLPTNPGILTGPAEVCQGGDAVFTLDPITLGADNYAWTISQNGQQLNITQNGPSPTRSLSFPYPPGQYDVCVQPTGVQLGCFGSSPVCTTITVNQLPVPAAFESGIVCTGDYYVAGNGDVFYFGGVFNLVYQTWQGCDSIVRLTLQQKVSDFKVVVKEVCAGECVTWNGEEVCETGTYDEVLQNQWGCDSTNQLLLISVPIETKISGADTIDCTNGSITLTSAGSVYAANPVYIWKKGATVIGNGTTLTINSGGTYTLEIQSTVAGKTCSDIATVTIVQNTTLPQGVTAIGGSITCSNGSVNLQGNSTTPGVSYSWAGPNGFSSNSPNPTVSLPGNYVLTVTGSNGCTKTATAIVLEDKTLPTALAVTNGSLNCNASSVLLSGAGSSQGGQFSYLWTTTDGQIQSGETTLTPTVNAAGNYLLTITNTNNGCTSTASTLVVAYPPVASQLSATSDISCFGASNGSATVTATGGTGSFTYLWNNGNTNATANNLAPGTYSVVVTDGNGCTATQSVTISQPALLVANATATGQTSFGINDGTATAAPTGGTGIYTYVWSNGETTPTITGLAPENYTVVVTDANGCTASQTVNVAAQNCLVKANFDLSNVSCPGAADGSATITLENATPPIVFAWSNGASTQTVTGLSGGFYDVTATDNFGCDVVATILIEEAQPIATNASTTNLTAYNSNDGSATVLPTGGTPPYSYLWSNGETTGTINNLPIGDYTVVVTDSVGCTNAQTVTINQFPCALSASLIVTNISCNGAMDGQATIDFQGGSAPFSFEWSNGETTSSIAGLGGGTYIATTTDANGCPSIAEATVMEPNPLGVEVLVEDEAECGAPDGSLSITATGGTTPYTYVWQNGETSETLGGITAGFYDVAITDANGCIENFVIELGTDDGVPPIAVAQDFTVALDSNGLATLLPTDLDGGSVDDCSITDMSLDISSFDCSNVGANTVILSVTDIGDNTTTALATVTVVDNLPPTLLLQAVDLALGDDGNASLEISDFDLGSTDNCGIAEWALSQSTFDCTNLGTQMVDLLVTDVNGNTATAQLEVNFIDTSAPTLNCPDPITLTSCDPVAIFDVSADDNCANLVLSQTEGPSSGSSFPVGLTQVSFNATDAGGNTATCSFSVNRPTEVSLDLTTQDASCFGENDGSAAITASGGVEPYTYLWSTGANTPDVTGLVASSYSVSVTDASGCTSVQTVVIDQPSLVITSLVEVKNAINGQSNGSIDVSVTGGNSPYSFEWTDDAGNVIGNSEDIAGLPAGTYTLTVLDQNGCVSQSGYTIQDIVSGTNDGELDRHLLLYPNPSSGIFTVELVGTANQEPMEITAFDVNGRILLQRHAVANQLTLNLSEYAAGVYLLKIRIGEQLLTRRLVISK